MHCEGRCKNAQLFDAEFVLKNNVLIDRLKHNHDAKIHLISSEQGTWPVDANSGFCQTVARCFQIPKATGTSVLHTISKVRRIAQLVERVTFNHEAQVFYRY